MLSELTVGLLIRRSLVRAQVGEPIPHWFAAIAHANFCEFLGSIFGSYWSVALPLNCVCYQFLHHSCLGSTRIRRSARRIAFDISSLRHPCWGLCGPSLAFVAGSRR